MYNEPVPSINRRGVVKYMHNTNLLVPMASISSIKTIDGECSSATLNSSLTSFGPSPLEYVIVFLITTSGRRQSTLV